jgi:DNA-binding NtrC family response regulator
MKRTTVFIIEKDTPVANLIRYQLLSQQAKHVEVFPTLAECLHFMQKRSIPDFLIADLAHLEIKASVFLKTVMQLFPGVKVLFLSPFTDLNAASQLMEEGASDYICTSGRMEHWIRELGKNMEFLIREKTL